MVRCNTPHCVHWAAEGCSCPSSISIRDHYCENFKGEQSSCRDFTSDARMKEIANNAVDYFGELHTGITLYELLRGCLKMTDEEILNAKFSTLKMYMDDE